jgi:type II secretory ATPase GspE/PulE/Tfp pilus assembly ATPase PilB-like protein
MSVEKSASEFFITLPDLSPEEAVGTLIDYATDLQASDLFFTAHAHHLIVQMRHFGICRMLTVLDPEFGRHCMAHIKALAGLDVTEQRRPQDGRWLRQRREQEIDIRISTLPTLYGEDFALHLLVRDTHLLTLENLGLRHRERTQLLHLLNSPSGLILVTGPTGCGKTTTLYAALKYLNNGERKINTIEDPIEYALAGIRQSQVNLRAGVDFPELLRSVLRQAPDVIMIGEIRDPVTAQTAVRAANSGHLVLATLHAPMSDGAVQSMLSLGVPPHFLGVCLRGVVAQRLVRTLCPQCKAQVNLSFHATLLEELRPWLEPSDGRVLFTASGCPACHRTGYAGRTGVFEVLSVGPTVRPLILDHQPTQVIRQQAVAEGMLDFRQAALLKVAQGQTTVAELIRVIPTEYLGPFPGWRLVERAQSKELLLAADLDGPEIAVDTRPRVEPMQELQPAVLGL